MPKDEVYSWRVSAEAKIRLESAARLEQLSVAALLDRIVAEHLDARGRARPADEARQRELHAQVARLAGRLSGVDPDRSVSVRETVRARLRTRISRGR